MSLPPQSVRGSKELRGLLRERTFDLRRLDLPGFRRWLTGHLERWHKDSVFLQRARIRDLRRAQPDLLALEDAHRQASQADAASPQFARLRFLQQVMIDTGKAVAGLTTALEQSVPERRPVLEQKLEAFLARRQELANEERDLVASSSRRQALLQIDNALEKLRSSCGLVQEEIQLAKLLEEYGHRSGRSGESFEDTAIKLTHNTLLPDLLKRCKQDEMTQRLRVLRGVTLGAAGIELDQLVIRVRRVGQPVEVLAVVEAKRNINDLAHGFRQRQENLTWLTGDDTRYDPAQQQTRQFPTGHFDREASHHQDGESFPFARTSFRRFQRDSATGLFLGRLYFITRQDPIWGISNAGLRRIQFRIATDERWRPDDDSYLAQLLGWCQSLTDAMETPDVLERYAAKPRWARQIVLVVP